MSWGELYYPFLPFVEEVLPNKNLILHCDALFFRFCLSRILKEQSLLEQVTPFTVDVNLVFVAELAPELLESFHVFVEFLHFFELIEGFANGLFHEFKIGK